VPLLALLFDQALLALLLPISAEPLHCYYTVKEYYKLY
jgi:hypothetical protein